MIKKDFMCFTKPCEPEKNLWKQNIKFEFKHNEQEDFSSASESDSDE